MPEILHHDAELADFLRVGAGREIFRGICVWKANYMKAHLGPPEMFDNRQGCENNPNHVEKNDGRKSLFSRSPN